MNWQHGSLITPPTPPEPEGQDIAALLDEAEDIVNAVVPQVRAEVDAEAGTKERGFFSRFRRKR